jgi:hypothetical protein
MKKLLTAVCVLGLGAGVLAGCSENRTDMGERPGERTPSASPRTAPSTPPPSATTPSSPPADSTTPKTPPPASTPAPGSGSTGSGSK